MQIRKILTLLEDANIALHQVDEMFKDNQHYDTAVIELAEAIRAMENFEYEVEVIVDDYNDAFQQFPAKHKDTEFTFDKYEDKHGV